MNPEMFHILSEPNRLNIVELLRTGPKPVNEIVYRLGLHQPQVSKHLGILSDAGIVEYVPLLSSDTTNYSLSHLKSYKNGLIDMKIFGTNDLIG